MSLPAKAFLSFQLAVGLGCRWAEKVTQIVPRVPKPHAGDDLAGGAIQRNNFASLPFFRLMRGLRGVLWRATFLSVNADLTSPVP